MEKKSADARSLLCSAVAMRILCGGSRGVANTTNNTASGTSKPYPFPQMNVAVAAHDLTAHAAWRATWTPCGRVLEVGRGALCVCAVDNLCYQAHCMSQPPVNTYRRAFVPLSPPPPSPRSLFLIPTALPPPPPLLHPNLQTHSRRCRVT